MLHMDEEPVPGSLIHKSPAQKIREFLVPSGVESTFYLTFSTIILLGLNGATIWNLLNNTSVALSDDYIIKSQLESLNERLGNFVVFGFWLGIGSICYMIFWSIQNIASRAKLDAEAVSNVGIQDTKSYWQSVFAHYFAFVSVTIGFLLYVLICLQFLLPTFLSMVNVSLHNLNVASSYFDLLLAILGTTFMLYAFHLIWYITRYIWRTIRVAS